MKNIRRVEHFFFGVLTI